MSDSLITIAAEFARRYGVGHQNLQSSEGATGRCSIVSNDFADHLQRRHGIVARTVRFQGHRVEVPNPDPERDGRGEHLAVLASGAVIDLTRRQFDPCSAWPVVYGTMNEAGRDWSYIFVDPQETVKRPLPTPADAPEHWASLG